MEKPNDTTKVLLCAFLYVDKRWFLLDILVAHLVHWPDFVPWETLQCWHLRQRHSSLL